MITYIKTDKGITLFAGGEVHNISKEDIFYEKVMGLIRDGGTEQEFIDLFESATYDKDGLVIDKNGNVTYKGETLPTALEPHIIAMFNEGEQLDPILRFLDRLADNPSNTAWEGLFRFIKACSMPITGNGKFLAYKRIRSDWTDCHTGKVSNKVGETVSMARRLVNDDPNETCSHGLHVCSREYLNHFHGDRIVLVEVDPFDVVAVPHDYRDSKMRVCKYRVLKEIEYSEAEKYIVD